MNEARAEARATWAEQRGLAERMGVLPLLDEAAAAPAHSEATWNWQRTHLPALVVQFQGAHPTLTLQRNDSRWFRNNRYVLAGAILALAISMGWLHTRLRGSAAHTLFLGVLLLSAVMGWWAMARPFWLGAALLSFGLLCWLLARLRLWPRSALAANTASAPAH
jgi:hypothetical protein